MVVQHGVNIDLSGKTALVTGSTQGIGFAIAEGLADSGARVAVNGRTPERVEEAVAKLRGDVIGVAVDVATEEGAAQLRRGSGDIRTTSAPYRPARSPTSSGAPTSK